MCLLCAGFCPRWLVSRMISCSAPTPRGPCPTSTSWTCLYPHSGLWQTCCAATDCVWSNSVMKDSVFSSDLTQFSSVFLNPFTAQTVAFSRQPYLIKLVEIWTDLTIVQRTKYQISLIYNWHCNCATRKAVFQLFVLIVFRRFFLFLKNFNAVAC